MSDSMKVGYLHGARPLTGAHPLTKPSSTPTTSFQEVLQRQMKPTTAELKFSSHAMERLEQRGIRLNAEEIGKLSEAVKDAKGKGSKSSLVLMNNVAYIVSVPNSTVVTAVDSHSMQNHVFTQIDSAVIL
jgi:flagellar operon protein